MRFRGGRLRIAADLRKDLSMPCQEFVAPLSATETVARNFYDRWIGRSGMLSFLGRLIFRLSGAAYSGPFIRAARVTPGDRVLKTGCKV